MAKTQKSIRISKLAERQLKQLTDYLGTTQTEVIGMALNQLYEKMEEQMNSTKTTYYISAIAENYGLSDAEEADKLAERLAKKLAPLFPQAEFVVTTDEVLLQNGTIQHDMYDGTIEDGLKREIDDMSEKLMEDCWMDVGL
jgi:hypothetical protein